MDLDDGIALIWIMGASSWIYVYLIGSHLLTIGLILTEIVGILTFSYGVAFTKKAYSKVVELSDLEILYFTGCSACILVFGGILSFLVPYYVLIT